MTFLDIEAMVRTFLVPVAAPRRVVTKVPAARPEEFVRAWRTGGAAANRILDRPIVTVQGWAGDSITALQLTSSCRDAFLNDARLMPLVRRVEEVTGLYYDPDPESGVDRYSFSVQLSVRAPR
jgi:hypothetical protein